MPFTAAGAEEGSHATDNAGSCSSTTVAGAVAEPATAEPGAEPSVAVEELATACSSGPSAQAAAQAAITLAVAEPVAIPLVLSSAASSAPTAKEAEESSSQAAGTFNAVTVPSAAQRTRTPGSQAANEPSADHATAPPAAGTSEGPGTSSGKGPLTSPVLETRMMRPGSQSPAHSMLAGISKEGSEAASSVAEPAAQKQRPTAAEATATPAEELVIDMAAAEHAERQPVRAADTAGVGTLPAQQDPAGGGGKASLTDARGATSEPATTGGDSRPNQATSSPAAGAEHHSGGPLPDAEWIGDPCMARCSEEKVDRALRLYAKSLALLEAYASALYLYMGNQADAELALDIIVEPSIYSGGIVALSDWQCE